MKGENLTNALQIYSTLTKGGPNLTFILHNNIIRNIICSEKDNKDLQYSSVQGLHTQQASTILEWK